MWGRGLAAGLAACLLVGTPALAAAPAGPLPVETWARLPAMDHVSVSPSGERLAFVAFDGKGRKLFVRDLAGKPLAVMDLAGAKVSSVTWAGDRLVLIGVSKPSRLSMSMRLTEQSTVFSLNVETGKIVQMFAAGVKAWDVVFGRHGVAEENGRWVGYFSTFEQKRNLTGEVDFVDYNPDLFRIDLETSDIDLVNRGDSNTSDWLVRDGVVVARLNYDEVNGRWSLTAGTTARVLAQGEATLGEVSLAGFGHDRTTAALVVADGEGRTVIEEIGLTDGATKVVSTSGDEVVMALADRRDRTLIGYLPDDVTPRAVLFDADRQAKAWKALKPFLAKRPVIVSSSADQDRMILQTDGGDDSGSFWLVDLKAGKADPLGEVYPRITPSRVGPSRLFSYKAADGLALDGVLTLPPGREAKGLPVVVLPHGGPESRDRLGFDWMAQAFAARGYAVIQPNFRGSSGRGRAFRDKGFGQWGRAMQTDLSDALAALAAEGIVDPKRACIVGASYGGYAAVAGVTLQNGLYRCSASFAGLFDLGAMMADTRPRSAGMRYWKAFMGAGNVGAISPTAAAGKADAPVLLIHGKDDVVVPYEQSSAMAAALRRAGKPVELVTLDSGDHWLTDEASRVAMLSAIVAFVEKHNPAN
ncbi:MAG: peptidase prolyl oligopeptidase [Caulobacter sp.]|nr:peptidase prolyl oligopeptidase [Caulobacter sp.]